LGLVSYVDSARASSLRTIFDAAKNDDERTAFLNEVRAYVQENVDSRDVHHRTNARDLAKLTAGILIGRAEYEETLAELDTLKHLGVDDVETLNMRAFALNQLERYDEVEAAYTEIRRRHPNRAKDVLEARLHFALSRQDFTGAADRIREYLAMGVPPKQAVETVQLLYAAEERDQAKELLESMLKGMRRNTDAVLLLAKIHADRNEFDDALALAREAWNQRGHQRSSTQGYQSVSYGGYMTYMSYTTNLSGNPILDDLYNYAKAAGKGRELVAEFEERLANNQAPSGTTKT
jgi:tetratricopeptide (TPR) repeat protein